MRRLAAIFMLATVLLVLITAIAFAQDGGTSPEVPTWPDTANILAWLNQDPVSWRAGILFFLGGFVGAAATAFGAVGGVIPGTSGKEEIDRLTRDLEVTRKRKEEYQAQYEEARKDSSITESRRKELREDLDKERIEEARLANALNSTKRTQYRLALPFYLILGGVFSTALAQDIVQSLAIGAGWPALWGALKLRPEFRALNQENAELEHAKDVAEANLKSSNKEKDVAERALSALSREKALVKQEITQTEPPLQHIQSVANTAAADPKKFDAAKADGLLEATKKLESRIAIIREAVSNKQL